MPHVTTHSRVNGMHFWMACLDASIPLQDLDVLLWDLLGIAKGEVTGGTNVMEVRQVPIQVLHMATTSPTKSTMTETRVDVQMDILCIAHTEAMAHIDKTRSSTLGKDLRSSGGFRSLNLSIVALEAKVLSIRVVSGLGVSFAERVSPCSHF